MNRNQMFVSGVVGTILVNGVLSITKTIREGRKERKAIETELEQELAKFNAATDRCLEKLENGKYRGMSFQDIMTDWKFEQIIERLND